MKSTKLNHIKKILSVALCLALMMSCVPVMSIPASAETAETILNIADGVIYFDENGWSQGFKEGNGDVIVTGESDENHLRIQGGTHNITLRNCKMDSYGYMGTFYIASNATVNLNIEGTNRLRNIYVPENSHINIDGAGSLELTDSNYAIGVDGGNESFGNITIAGGYLIIHGKIGSAALHDDVGNVFIKGGTIVGYDNNPIEIDGTKEGGNSIGGSVGGDDGWGSSGGGGGGDDWGSGGGADDGSNQGYKAYIDGGSFKLSDDVEGLENSFGDELFTCYITLDGATEGEKVIALYDADGNKIDYGLNGVVTTETNKIFIYPAYSVTYVETENGIYQLREECSAYTQNYTTQIINHSHNYDGYRVEKLSDTQHKEIIYCEDCFVNKIHSEQPVSHSFSSSLTRPTRTAEGYYTHTCTACYEETTEAVERPQNFADFKTAINTLEVLIENEILTEAKSEEIKQALAVCDADEAYQYIAGEEALLAPYIEQIEVYTEEIDAEIKNCISGKHTGDNGICEICGDHICDFKNNGFCSCGAYEPATDFNFDGCYEISNAGQLFWFAEQVNEVGNREIKGVLTDDINLENRPWTPIGTTGENNNNFRGVFDGQGHIITGLNVTGTKNGIGFFGEVRTGTVENFTIYGEVTVPGKYTYAGGVIGSACGLNTENDLERNGATIRNIKSFVNLTLNAHGVGRVGGFMGYANHETLIENCEWYGTFDLGGYRAEAGVAGFLGRVQENSDVTIRNCGAYGTVKTNYKKGDYNGNKDIFVCGFLGWSVNGSNSADFTDTVIENCLFAGKVELGENITDQIDYSAFGCLSEIKSIRNCYYLGENGLPGVNNNSTYKPSATEVISVDESQLASGEVAYHLQQGNTVQVWGQQSNTSGSLPVLTDNELYKVVEVGETGNYSVSNVGDTNGDGVVDELDYQALVNEFLSGSNEQVETADYDDIVRYDLNGDGYLDAIDAALMHNFINGFITIDVYTVGDYDCNGKAFEEADITAIKHAIENPEVLSTSEKYASDINGDGKVSEEDLKELTAI